MVRVVSNISQFLFYFFFNLSRIQFYAAVAILCRPWGVYACCSNTARFVSLDRFSCGRHCLPLFRLSWLRCGCALQESQYMKDFYFAISCIIALCLLLQRQFLWCILLSKQSISCELTQLCIQINMDSLHQFTSKVPLQKKIRAF